MIVRHIPRPWAKDGGDPAIRPLTERRSGAVWDLANEGSAARTPRTLLWAVAFAAVAMNAISLASTHLWIYPDSIDYIELAARVVRGLDLRDELYLIRTPAYPFFLAGIFAVFGSWSPEVIVVLQHAMAIGVAVVTSALSWHLTRNRAAALAGGLLCAGSLQLLAYANLALTEIPFTFTLTLCAYLLVRFVEQGRWRTLIGASALCGAAYLFRPVGLCLVGSCVLAGWLRCRADRAARNSALMMEGISNTARRSVIRSTTAAVRIRGFVRWAAPSLVYGVVPALVVAGPWMVLSRSLHHGARASACLDYVLYLRAASFDGLDSTQSTALHDIKATLEEAKTKGLVPAQATYRDRPAVEQALRRVRGADFAEISVLLGRAGRDLMREHPWPTFVNTFKYAAWMVLDADPVYRFVPDGEPGRAGGRAKEAELFDIGTYSVGEGSWEKTLDRFTAYLPLETRARAATPVWTTLVRAFRRGIDQGSGVTRITDSHFAELMLLCGFAGVTMLFSARRSAWLTVLSVIGLHVLVSAFLAGPLTRYAVAVKPLILMCGGVGWIVIFESVRRWIRRAAETAVGMPRTATHGVG